MKMPTCALSPSFTFRMGYAGLGGHPLHRNPALVTKDNEAGLCVLISALHFLGEGLDSNITDKSFLPSVLAVKHYPSVSVLFAFRRKCDSVFMIFFLYLIYTVRQIDDDDIF
jgi:hypothetical protein